MIYLSSSPSGYDNDVCIAKVNIKKERRAFICDHFVMVLITKGQGTYLEEDTGISHKFEQGDIMQRIPGKPHAQVFDTDNNTQFFLKVPTALYDLMKERGEVNDQRILKVKYGDAFAEFQHCLEDCIAKNDPAYSLWRVKDLISKLHKMSRQEVPQSDQIDEALKYLNLHITGRVSLPELAARLNMSYINFRRKFKEQTGFSPGAWLIQKRVERAAQLLKSDEFSIKNISEFLGYPDVYTFSKQFKKETGFSPSEYREYK